MDCNTCKDKTEPVSYLAFESMKSTMERTVKRLWIVVIILIVLLFGTNAAWLYYESKMETVNETEVAQEVDTGEGSAYVAGIGDVYYGESEADN